MPYIETVDELAENLATMLGIYNHGLQLVHPEDDGSSHTDACECRQCWCGEMARRIRKAVANETRLACTTRQTV